MRCIYWLISLLLLISCRQGGNGEKALDNAAEQAQALDIRRYEMDLFTADRARLKEEVARLQKDYSFFLGDTPPDGTSLANLQAYLEDTVIRMLYQSAMVIYPELDSLERELGAAMYRMTQILPGEKIPTVYTYISGLDYEAPVRLADTVMIIALDMYLGKDCPYYPGAGIPEYRVLACSREFIMPDCMRQPVTRHLGNQPAPKTLLDWMIYQGKILSFLDAVLTETPDHLKIAYSRAQLQWCVDHEKDIWAFLIANNLLFTTDSKEIMNFISEAPFTKGMSNDSPGRIGGWVGWQIVRQFIRENPEVSFDQLLKMTDSQSVLSRSGYRPEK